MGERIYGLYYPPVTYDDWLHLSIQFALRGAKEASSIHKLSRNLRNQIEDKIRGLLVRVIEENSDLDDMRKLEAVKLYMEALGFGVGCDLVEENLQRASKVQKERRHNIRQRVFSDVPAE